MAGIAIGPGGETRTHRELKKSLTPSELASAELSLGRERFVKACAHVPYPIRPGGQDRPRSDRRSVRISITCSRTSSIPRPR